MLAYWLAHYRPISQRPACVQETAWETLAVLTAAPDRLTAKQLGQQGVLAAGHRLPEATELEIVRITERAAVVAGLETEQRRYYLQHRLGFQIHDQRHPHDQLRHGRSDIGWKDAGTS